MPKKCAICNISTEGVPTFIVTQKRKENWEFVVPIPLLVGDRICQTHFPKDFLIKENIKDGPEQTKRSRVLLKADAYPIVEFEGLSNNIPDTFDAIVDEGNKHTNQLPSKSNSVGKKTDY